MRLLLEIKGGSSQHNEACRLLTICRSDRKQVFAQYLNLHGVTSFVAQTSIKEKLNAVIVP